MWVARLDEARAAARATTMTRHHPKSNSSFSLDIETPDPLIELDDMVTVEPPDHAPGRSTMPLPSLLPTRVQSLCHPSRRGRYRPPHNLDRHKTESCSKLIELRILARPPVVVTHGPDVRPLVEEHHKSTIGLATAGNLGQRPMTSSPQPPALVSVEWRFAGSPVLQARGPPQRGAASRRWHRTRSG